MFCVSHILLVAFPVHREAVCDFLYGQFCICRDTGFGIISRSYLIVITVACQYSLFKHCFNECIYRKAGRLKTDTFCIGRSIHDIRLLSEKHYAKSVVLDRFVFQAD